MATTISYIFVKEVFNSDTANMVNIIREEKDYIMVSYIINFAYLNFLTKYTKI